MNTGENISAPSNAKSPRRPRYRRRWVEGVVVAGLLLLIAHLVLGSRAGYRQRHTCVVCRLERVDRNWRYWTTTSAYRKTACSQWYAANVEPAHRHVWAPNSSHVVFDFYGRAIGAGSNDERPGRAVWRLTPDEQIEVYRRLANPLEAKAIFLSLTDPAVMKDRQDFAIVASLRAWMESGFEGDWQAAQQDRDPTGE